MIWHILKLKSFNLLNNRNIYVDSQILKYMHNV